LTCNTDLPQKYFLDNTCYEICPLQYVNQEIPTDQVDPSNPLQNKYICTGCNSGCDRCNVDDISICERCGEKLYLYEG
jgi:dissimilatory sulfite reductase (desulfoviridin) alpha/beta subunit